MPPFSGSDVPLEEDILKKTGKREFFPSFLEFAADTKTQIIESGTATGVLFTVPERQTLFITEAFLGGGATGNNVGSLGIDINGSFFLAAAVGQNGTANAALNFRKPIKAESGSIITLTDTSASGLAELVGGFSGFLVDKKIS